VRYCSLVAAPPVLLRPVGYWTTRPGDGLPDPRALMSPTWERGRRDLIASYLGSCAVLAEDDALHECVICGVSAGYRERTDGVWRWPEGLGHYVFEHGVRLPGELLQMMARLDFRAPRVDVKKLREQLSPQDLQKTGLLSEALARAALEEGPEAGPVAISRREPGQPRPRGARGDIDDPTAAIPVTQAWTARVQGVPTRTPRVVFDRPIVLGRDRTCDLVLEHRSVSRRHVRLVPWRDRVIAQDLGSANGIHLKGARRDGQIELKDGEQLMLGQATITLVRDSSGR
jgi:hypothetical protein